MYVDSRSRHSVSAIIRRTSLASYLDARQSWRLHRGVPSRLLSQGPCHELSADCQFRFIESSRDLDAISCEMRAAPSPELPTRTLPASAHVRLHLQQLKRIRPSELPRRGAAARPSRPWRF